SGLKTYGEVKPRQAKPVDHHPYRGVGVQGNGSVSLARHSRWLFVRSGQVPKLDGPVILDTLTLAQKDWATLAPVKAVSGAEWTVPEATARKLSPVLSTSTEAPPAPEDVTAVKLSGKV